MKFEKPINKKFFEAETFKSYIKHHQDLSYCTIQGLDFTGLDIAWSSFKFDNTIFTGCTLTFEEEIILRKKGAYLYNAPGNLPYNPFRHTLYTWQELMQGFSEENDNCLDLRIYRHFIENKYNPPINEAMWQRIHDHAMDDALRSLLDFDGDGMSSKKTVSIMGGHSIGRDNPYFLKTAQTAKLLAENGYFIASGGGPGIMEAANLGAYMAGREEGDLLTAIHMLKQAPKYTDKNYIGQALKVLDFFPAGNDNLAIPTWFYGHEPSNLFASHIAKYFSNGLREDTLVASSIYGIVFSPGSAGTTQEIFMDATQNHYGTFNFYSPMIFLGKKRYEIDTLIFPLLKQLSWDKKYHELLFLTDSPQEVLEFLQNNPPIKSE